MVGAGSELARLASDLADHELGVGGQVEDDAVADPCQEPPRRNPLCEFVERSWRDDRHQVVGGHRRQHQPICAEACGNHGGRRGRRESRLLLRSRPGKRIDRRAVDALAARRRVDHHHGAEQDFAWAEQGGTVKADRSAAVGSKSCRGVWWRRDGTTP